MPGKAKVPFPQFDKPGSKISPYTGKPYTIAEAKQVHQNTLKADSSRRQISKMALQRRLNSHHDDAPTAAKVAAKGKGSPWKQFMANKDKRGSLGDQLRSDRAKLSTDGKGSPWKQFRDNGGLKDVDLLNSKSRKANYAKNSATARRLEQNRIARQDGTAKKRSPIKTRGGVQA